MTGLEVGQGLHPQLRAVVVTLGGKGCQHQPEMIARSTLIHDRPREPPRTVSEHRGPAVRPKPPLASVELVDLVAGLLAEQPG